MASNAGAETLVFAAISSSARQLFILLRCISFAAKAQVQITADGLQFSVEGSPAVQGFVFLDKELFTSYSYNPVDPSISLDPFEISLSALLETLQIFSTDAFPRQQLNQLITSINRPSAFSPQSLGTTSLCQMSYPSPGSPFQLHLSESGVKTTCALTTYESSQRIDLPLDRTSLALKIILNSAILHDAIIELSPTNPTRLVLSASPRAPCLTLSGAGALGSASVEFTKDPQILETFEVARRMSQEYAFAGFQQASRAMAVARKVSIRIDKAGVASFQFLVDCEEGKSAFVEVRFLPFLREEEGGAEEE